MEQIYLRDARKDVDKNYVGFTPNTSSIKPVHIASGAFRSIYGKSNQSMKIRRMVLVSDAKGVTPPGNETEEVYKQLLQNEEIEDSISESALESMRNTMQRLLNVDKGVYVVQGLRDGMISYSAGSKYFLTSSEMHESAGEFMGGIIKEYCPELAEYIKGLLENGNDPITILFNPILEEDMEIYPDQSQHEDIPAFKKMNKNTKWFIQGIKESADCLLDNFREHPNVLTQLRLFNLFCVFSLIRYLTMLESFYCNGSVRPIFLDFSGKSPSSSSVARMSEMSYTQMYKSINRFYAWGFANWLNERGYTKTDLINSATPVYEKGKSISKASKEELDALWDLAKERVEKLDEKSMYLEFGETMYDMLALEASSHPVPYIRSLGTLAGILYPPDKLHPNKRFVISQDVLEMLLRSCVHPGEVISNTEIRQRLWNRFGIIVGGSQFEMDMLISSGMILQSDEDALEENFNAFAATLESMDFAEVMADGILQIRLGGAEYDD